MPGGLKEEEEGIELAELNPPEEQESLILKEELARKRERIRKLKSALEKRNEELIKLQRKRKKKVTPQKPSTPRKLTSREQNRWESWEISQSQKISLLEADQSRSQKLIGQVRKQKELLEEQIHSLNLSGPKREKLEKNLVANIALLEKLLNAQKRLSKEIEGRNEVSRAMLVQKESNATVEDARKTVIAQRTSEDKLKLNFAARRKELGRLENAARGMGITIENSEYRPETPPIESTLTESARKVAINAAMEKITASIPETERQNITVTEEGENIIAKKGEKKLFTRTPEGTIAINDTDSLEAWTLGAKAAVATIGAAGGIRVITAEEGQEKQAVNALIAAFEEKGSSREEALQKIKIKREGEWKLASEVEEYKSEASTEVTFGTSKPKPPLRNE
ncbi:MAG: hypothetical protein JW855_00530 [Gammaproteobacteria bacterium]|nr:hypothetical protein [Gammaproteobacteria bacterium]